MNKSNESLKWEAQFEVFLVYLVAGLGILARNVVYRIFWASKMDESRRWIFLFEFVCLVVPMVLVQTIFAERLYATVILLIALISPLVFISIWNDLKKASKRKEDSIVSSNEALYNSITWFRAMVLSTVGIAILAVDFDVYPKRFAKTQNYGHSVMDSGTAAFVFISALSDYSAILRAGGDASKVRKSYVSAYSVKIPSIFIVLLLGVGRSIFIRFFSYQHVVTEYGVHWNFFVTLFCLRVFAMAIGYPRTIWVGLLLGVFYQLALTKFGLEQWILRSDDLYKRIGYLDENREGIFSLFGYIFLYSLALLYSKFSTAVLLGNQRLSLSGIIPGLGFSCLCLLVQKTLEFLSFTWMEPSRRLANLPYAFSMAALFSLSVSGLQLFNFFIPVTPPSSKISTNGLVQAISRNGLVYFLVANLLTGITNILSIPVRIYDDMPQSLFLMFYSFTTASIIYFLNQRRVKID